MAKPASSRSSEPGCMCRPHNFIIVLWWSLSAESSLHATNLDIPDQTSLRPNRLSLTGGSWARGPLKATKNGFYSATTFSGNATLPCPLSSRPELRTRISYFALLATSTCAALLKESRMRSINATVLDRKSGGGAQWRICGSGPFLEMSFGIAPWKPNQFELRLELCITSTARPSRPSFLFDTS